MVYKAIFVVAGHNTEDPGAVGIDTTERREVVEIANECLYLLNRQKSLESEIYSIGVSEGLSVREKIAAINAICSLNNYTWKNSLLISIHANAGGASGLETFYYNGSDRSLELSATIGGQLAMSTQLEYRGEKPDTSASVGRLAIVRDTKPLATLVECGFIDNLHDSRLLRDSQKDNAFAEGIAKGVMSFLSLPYTDTPIPAKIFHDIPQESWYTKGVYRALEEGLMTGYPDGSFRPHQPVTRAELAVVLERLNL